MMTTVDYLPLIKAPASWPAPVVATLAMVVLAGLDLAGAVAAKEWVEHRSGGMLAAGLSTFIALWWVYASSLQYAELAVVTLGWVVVLQVGLIMIDRLRYAAELPPGKWVAIAVVLAGQAYLMLAPSTAARATA